MTKYPPPAYKYSMHSALRPGDNPRIRFRQHRERGPKRFATVTYEAISEAIGKSVSTVKKAAVRKPGGARLVMSDLGSVALYIAAAAGWMQLSVEETRMIERLRAGTATTRDLAAAMIAGTAAGRTGTAPIPTRYRSMPTSTRRRQHASSPKLTRGLACDRG